MNINKLYVVGIGYKPLDKRARKIILNSGVILASSRLFEVFKGYEEFEAVKDRVKVINNVNETIEFIRAEIQENESIELKDLQTSEFPSFRAIVLLASGDPMFFGIGRRAVKEFGKDMVEILPDLTSIQMAFARIKEPWDDAFLMSLHGGPDPEKRRRLPHEIKDIPSLLKRHNKIAILTDRENNPSEIARVLDLSPVASSMLPVMIVCERLGYPDEKITEGRPADIKEMNFLDPNVVIIKKEDNPTPSSFSREEITALTFGLKESEILHSRGLITKDEVRAITIHKLRFPSKGVFWDIGAGSGSVSIEAARLCPELNVFAIEKDQEQINHIRENIMQFSIPNIEIISGEAPDALDGLPAPDRVFIGGSGGMLKEIMRFIGRVMQSGVIVINATTLETLSLALSLLKEENYSVDVAEVNISRLKLLENRHHLRSQNPVFIITGRRCRFKALDS